MEQSIHPPLAGAEHPALRLPIQPVPDTPDGDEMPGICWIDFQLGTQGGDEVLDGPQGMAMRSSEFPMLIEKPTFARGRLERGPHSARKSDSPHAFENAAA
jgi:hypothetical protein